jgi:hypothetical protein
MKHLTSTINQFSDVTYLDVYLTVFILIILSSIILIKAKHESTS